MDIANLAMLTGRSDSDGDKRPSVQISPEQVGEMKRRLDVLKVEGVRRRSIAQEQMLGRGANAVIGRTDAQDKGKRSSVLAAPGSSRPFSSRDTSKTNQDLEIRMATRNALRQKRHNKEAACFIVAWWIEPGVVEGRRFAKEADAQAFFGELGSGANSARIFDVNYRQLGSCISRLQRQGDITTMDDDFRMYWENDLVAHGMSKPGAHDDSAPSSEVAAARRNSAIAGIRARRNSHTTAHIAVQSAARRNSGVAFGAKITSTGPNAMKEALAQADKAAESLCKTPDSCSSGDELQIS